MSFWQTAALSVIVACTPQTISSYDSTPRAVDRHAAQRQLRGHLERVDDCIARLRAQDPHASGLVDLELVVHPSGSVSDVEVRRNTSGHGSLAECVARKVAALHFDPAPPRAMRHRRVFRFCEPGVESVCRLGPLVDADGRTIGGSLAEGIRSLETAIATCQRERAPDAEAALSIELHVARDGRVASGWLRHSLPATTPLRACAVTPLLNAKVADELDTPTTARFTLGIGAELGVER